MSKEKKPEIKVWEKTYFRIPIKTNKVVMKEDNIFEIVQNSISWKTQENDIVFVTEKIVAITQWRAFLVEDIKPRKLAKILSSFVKKTPAWIGLWMPETMEMAIREVWICRILFATFCSAVTKPFGKKWAFYKIAWYRASSIDWPTPNTIPPYNKHVVLWPLNPDKVAKEISEKIWTKVIITDINDIWWNILWISDETLDRKLLVKILKDNPLGQDCEQTPIWIIREVK